MAFCASPQIFQKPITMKLIKVFVCLLLLVSCQHKNKQGLTTITGKLKNEKTLKYPWVKDSPILFISCVKCNCIFDELKKIKADPILKEYIILTDTSCNKPYLFDFPLIHIAHNRVDSIYDENYNIVLFKTINSICYYKQISTEESKSLKKYLELFLK
jgi:hypothetical protein